MKMAGLLLLTAGFLAGAYVAVLHRTNEVDWQLFVPAIVVAAVGVTLARLSAQRAARSEDRLSGNVRLLEESLENVVARMGELCEKKDRLDVYRVHEQIDALFPQSLNAFVEARESLIHVYGLQAYADVMNPFAAGERYLNRVWSCSVDGYVDELNEYLDRSQEQFSVALATLRELAQRRG